MDQRTRDRNDLLPPQQGPADGAPDKTRLGEIRCDGEHMLSEGDDTLRRALSGNSGDFLDHSRQSGGE